jgi:hypothetical protein
MLYMLYELNIISVLEFRCHLHTLYCMGAMFVYRIRIGLLNQKAFALLGRVCFGVIAANAEIFIGRGGGGADPEDM